MLHIRYWQRCIERMLIFQCFELSMSLCHLSWGYLLLLVIIFLALADVVLSRENPLTVLGSLYLSLGGFGIYWYCWYVRLLLMNTMTLMMDTFGWFLLHGKPMMSSPAWMIGAMVRRALAACAGCYNWVVVGGGSYAGKLWCKNHDIVIGFANPGFTCAIIASSTRSNLSLKHMNWIGCLKFQHIIYKDTCFIIVVMLALGSRSFVGSRWQATRLDGGRGQEARTSSSLPWPSLRCESQRILIQKNLSLNSDGISILHIKS